MSADETYATLFEMFKDRDGAKLRGENLLASPLIGPFQELFTIKGFAVLGPAKKDLNDLVTSLVRGYENILVGFTGCNSWRCSGDGQTGLAQAVDLGHHMIARLQPFGGNNGTSHDHIASPQHRAAKV